MAEGTSWTDMVLEPLKSGEARPHFVVPHTRAVGEVRSFRLRVYSDAPLELREVAPPPPPPAAPKKKGR